jgi:uncharacterized protein YnzC (UPF0291/DUF896 family)
MITKELVDRINYLARKQRNGGLTDDERYEQKKLRERYLEGIRMQMVDALDSMGLKPKGQPGEQNEKHHGGCSCEHCHGSEKTH